MPQLFSLDGVDHAIGFGKHKKSKKMNTILLVIECPLNADTSKLGKWLKIAETAGGVSKPNTGYDTLNAGTFLIRSSDGLCFLGHAIGQSQEDGFQYRVLFFEKPSELPKPPDEDNEAITV
jgi:hypothetical protein